MNADRDERLEKIRHFEGNVDDFKSYLEDKIRETEKREDGDKPKGKGVRRFSELVSKIQQK